MSYSCLEELQVDLDLHALDKINILSKVGCKYKRNNWLIVTDDGICHLFDKDGNPDDIKKVTQLEEKHIRKDITKVVIPDSVTSIGSSTFYDCHVLTSVTIGNGVMSIGSSAFENCDGLTGTLMISDSVTSIGFGAFYNCSGLANMMIPDSVTNIGPYAFYGCDKLANLIFKGQILEQVKKMTDYPWRIKDESIIRVG